jgi:hypothetical protein
METIAYQGALVLVLLAIVLAPNALTAYLASREKDEYKEDTR